MRRGGREGKEKERKSIEENERVRMSTRERKDEYERGRERKDEYERGRERKDENLTETIRSREYFVCVYEKRERRRERER